MLRWSALAAVAGVVLFSALGASGVAQAATGSVIDQQSTTYSEGRGTGGTAWAQTFTPTMSGPVTEIDLWQRGDITTDTGLVTVSIQAIGANGRPDGISLGSGSRSAPGVSGWFPVSIAPTGSVVAGKQYAIVFTNASGTYLALSDSGYPIGALYYTGGGGYQDVNADLTFREWVQPKATIDGTPTSGSPVGDPYSYQYDVGGADATVSSTGTLPPGLTLSTSGLLSGTPTAAGTYPFTVTATNAYGSTSVASTVVIRDRIAPSAPQSATAVAGATSATVTWDAPATTGDDPVDHYTVTATPGGAAQSVTGTSATFTDLQAGTAYTFAVTATSASGTSPAATTPAVTPYTTPGAPIDFSATAGDTSAALSWSAPASDGYSPLTGYVIEASADGGPFTTVATPAATDTSATISGLDNGSAYVFRIAAQNAAGSGATASSERTTPYGLASSPLALTATPGDESATLQWTAPATDNGSPVTGYAVQYSTDGTTWVDAPATDGTTTTITGLTNGTAYSFRVAAVNAAGTSGWSDTATTIPVTLASAPTETRVVPGDRTATVTWEPATDDGGSTITGYTVEVRTGSGAWTSGASVAPTATTARVTGLTNGTAYEFRVRAVTAVGAGTPGAVVERTPFVFTPSALDDAGKAISGTTVQVGDHVRVTATDLPAGSTVTIRLSPGGAALKTVTIPATGVLDADVVIPVGAAAGEHSLVLTLSDTGADPVTVSFPVTVAVATPAAVIRAQAEAAALAFTGSTVPPALFVGAGAALLLGAVLAITARIRRRAGVPATDHSVDERD